MTAEPAFTPHPADQYFPELIASRTGNVPRVGPLTYRAVAEAAKTPL
jgi:hypothetical protein